jgi:glycopeptide antibiotics resistance protein
MMFLLAYVWIRLERLVLPLLKLFHALAGIESARSAIILIAFNSPYTSLRMSRLRMPSSLNRRVPAPVPARRPS